MEQDSAEKAGEQKKGEENKTAGAGETAEKAGRKAGETQGEKAGDGAGEAVKAQKEKAEAKAPAAAEPNETAKKKREEKAQAESKKREITLERVFTVNLSKAYEAPKRWRQNAAARLLREFCARHFNAAAESVRIDGGLNRAVRSRGPSAVPKRIKIRLTKDKEGATAAELAVASGGGAKKKS